MTRDELIELTDAYNELINRAIDIAQVRGLDLEPDHPCQLFVKDDGKCILLYLDHETVYSDYCGYLNVEFFEFKDELLYLSDQEFGKWKKAEKRK